VTLGLAERRVCRVLGQPRLTQRYQREPPDGEGPLTQAIIGLASQYGRYGYRQITGMLRNDGWRMNHKRVERIWRREGAEETTAASACRRCLSRRGVPGKTAISRALIGNYGMNCWIGNCLIHSGRSRCSWNGGDRRITGFGPTVRWAIVRQHRKQSRHSARDLHSRWYNYRGQVSLPLEVTYFLL
jgi:hypothetical protein